MTLLREWNPEEDYPLIEQWWIGHREEPLPLCMLPHRGVLSLDSDGAPRLAAWVSVDCISQIAHLDFLVSNPANDLEETLIHAAAAVKFLQRIAEIDGALWFFAVTDRPAIAALVQKLGLFDVVESAHSRMFKVLCCEGGSE